MVAKAVELAELVSVTLPPDVKVVVSLTGNIVGRKPALKLYVDLCDFVVWFVIIWGNRESIRQTRSRSFCLKTEVMWCQLLAAMLQIRSIVHIEN